MNSFDASIIHFLNGFSQKSMFFDRLMNFVVDNYFIKGGIVMSMLWFLWFHKSPKIKNNKEGVLITLLSTFIAIIIGRLLEMTLPFRVRPAYNQDINFIKPYRFGNYGLDNWSSFPSDHAVMFFALATGIFLISKKAGILTYLYVFFIICFPRMYLGLHYPTDILVGAVIGIFISFIVSKSKIFAPLIKQITQFSSNHPGYFYALFFLLSFQISDLFEEIRTIGAYLYEFLRKVI